MDINESFHLSNIYLYKKVVNPNYIYKNSLKQTLARCDFFSPRILDLVWWHVIKYWPRSSYFSTILDQSCNESNLTPAGNYGGMVNKSSHSSPTCPCLSSHAMFISSPSLVLGLSRSLFLQHSCWRLLTAWSTFIFLAGANDSNAATSERMLLARTLLPHLITAPTRQAARYKMFIVSLCDIRWRLRSHVSKRYVHVHAHKRKPLSEGNTARKQQQQHQQQRENDAKWFWNNVSTSDFLF